MDFGWFLTIPGMLITGGVLLLIIALVIFIATSNKKGKGSNSVSKKSEDGAKEMVADMNQGVVNNTVPDNSVSMGVDMNVPTNVVDPMAVGMATNPEQQMNGAFDQNTVAMPSADNMAAPVSVGDMSANSVDVSVSPVTNTVSSFDVPLVNENDMTSSNSMNAVPVATEANSVMPEVSSTSPMMPEVAPSMEMPTVNPVDVQTAPETVPMASVQNVEMPAVNSADAPVAPEVPVMPDVLPVQSVEMPAVNSADAPVASEAPVMPDVVPVQNVEMPAVNSADAPVAPEVPVMPDVVPVQNVDMPAVNSAVASVAPEAPVMPDVAPVQNVEMPAVNSVEASAPVQEAVSIYGGANPAVANISVGEEHHQIYGGANPLENTQSISIDDINQAAAATMAQNNAVTPVQAVTSEVTPSVEQPIATPTVAPAPVAPVTPEVVVAPSVSPVQNPGQMQ